MTYIPCWSHTNLCLKVCSFEKKTQRKPNSQHGTCFRFVCQMTLNVLSDGVRWSCIVRFNITYGTLADKTSNSDCALKHNCYMVQQTGNKWWKHWLCNLRIEKNWCSVFLKFHNNVIKTTLLISSIKSLEYVRWYLSVTCCDTMIELACLCITSITTTVTSLSKIWGSWDLVMKHIIPYVSKNLSRTSTPKIGELFSFVSAFFSSSLNSKPIHELKSRKFSTLPDFHRHTPKWTY